MTLAELHHESVTLKRCAGCGAPLESKHHDERSGNLIERYECGATSELRQNLTVANHGCVAGINGSEGF